MTNNKKLDRFAELAEFATNSHSEIKIEVEYTAQHVIIAGEGKEPVWYCRIEIYKNKLVIFAVSGKTFDEVIGICFDDFCIWRNRMEKVIK